MHLDRDIGQPGSDEYLTDSDIGLKPSQSLGSRLVQVDSTTLGSALNRTNQPLTRESLVERHDLDPKDPETAALLDRILDLRDVAKIKSFLHAIADRNIAAFKKARQSGNGTSPQQELQNP